MTRQVTLIGFGEAGQTFARAGEWRERAVAYDKLTDDAPTRAAKLADYAALNVDGEQSLTHALRQAKLILSLVTADQALTAAHSAARSIETGALYCDLNSVAPATKRAAAEAVEQSGGRYVDVAIMAPVNPGRLGVPLLVSGPHAEHASQALSDLGFTNVRSVGPKIGQASAIKMIRSVLVKGTEALIAECLLAADAAGVTDEVRASLDASDKSIAWQERADYALNRMIVHGLRRAEEMEEVVKTLEDLGVEPLMTRSTVRRQRDIGKLRIGRPPESLTDKIRIISDRKAEAA